MSTFGTAQQTKHRKAFIEECRQKAWGATCHSDWISKNVDELLGHYSKLQEEDRALEADIKELGQALDYHTVENRQMRKEKQERRNVLAKEMQLIAQNAQKGTQAMQQLLQSAESALHLAAHAETWEWKEMETQSEEKAK
jgi:regulator of replication initiation timing